MATRNKDHWYDGWFYDRFIAPNQDTLFKQIQMMIQPNSTIIDVGCGTGRFSFSIAEKCSSVVGLDISLCNIDRAEYQLLKIPDEKISFLHADIEDIARNSNRHFDYAIMTYVIHEIDESMRVRVLQAMAAIADTIIIGDYLVPKPKGFWSKLNNAIEFAAGSDHYNNYNNYVANGGILGLLPKAGLKAIHEIHNSPATSQIVVIARQ